MAEGLSTYAADATLDAIGNNTSFAVTTAYAQLHTGAPGSAGTSNVAANSTRKSVSFGAASSGSMDNDAAVTWSSGEVTTTETYTHVSLWDASSGGNFLGSGTVTDGDVTAGTEWELPIGDLTLAFTVAS